MRARVYVHPAPLRADSWNWSKYSAGRSSRYFCGFISGMARAGREAPRGRSLLTAPSPVTAAARDPTNGGGGENARRVAAGGGVGEVHLVLPHPVAGADGVDGHPDLHAEAPGEGE